MSQQNHLLPVIPDRVADQEGDYVDHRHMCPENVAVEILNREQTEVVSGIGRDLLQVVYDIDRATRGKHRSMILSWTYRRMPPTRIETARNSTLRSRKHLRNVTPSKPKAKMRHHPEEASVTYRSAAACPFPPHARPD